MPLDPAEHPSSTHCGQQSIDKTNPRLPPSSYRTALASETPRRTRPPSRQQRCKAKAAPPSNCHSLDSSTDRLKSERACGLAQGERSQKLGREVSVQVEMEVAPVTANKEPLRSTQKTTGVCFLRRQMPEGTGELRWPGKAAVEAG